MLPDVCPNRKATNQSCAGISLPIPVAPSDVEGVRELLFRAAVENGFRHTEDILNFAGFGSQRKLSAVASSDYVYDVVRLQSLLGTKFDLGGERDGVRNRIESSRDWVNFLGAAVRRSLLSPWRRVSPLRLRQTPILHAMWAIRPIQFDLLTRELLISECPRCKCRLTWEWAEDVTLCGSCAVRGERCDLREFPQPLVDLEDEAGVRFVADQLDPESSHRRPNYSLHADLQNLSRGQLFHLAVKIAAALSATNPSVGLPPSAIGRAGRAILHWPHGFEELLDQDTSANGSAERFCVGKRPLSRLGADRTLARPLRSKIKDLLSQQRRKEIFGLRERLDTGILKSSRVPRSEIIRIEAKLRLAVPKAFRLITSEEEEAHALTLIIRDIRHCRAVADEMGLPPFELLQLYEKGMLPELHDDLRHIARRPVDGPGVIAALRNIRSTSDRGIPLVRVASLFRGRNDIPWAQVLAAVQDRSLRVTRGSQQGLGILGALWTVSANFSAPSVVE